ncbi:MAG: sugar porter family MFS transporter [Bacteroidales bacterium]|nr:sugar porter family MFS transporter [Bacteroidales bacterium]
MTSLLHKFRLTGLAFTAALGGFLFGYDTAVISGTLSFVRDQFDLTAGLEGWYVSSALVGCVFSVIWAGWLSDRFGRKIILLLTAILFSLSAIGCALSSGFSSLIIFRFVGGMGVGIASMISPMYISEISPPGQRGRLVALYQLAITIGILAAFFVNSWLLNASNTGAFVSNPSLHLIFKSEVWRAMLGMESLPALVFLILVITIPESPRWLIVNKKLEKARSILVRIVGEEGTVKEMKEIQATMAMETGTWKMLLEPGIKVAVFLGVSLAMLAQFTGIDAIIYYGPRIMEQAGFAIGEALGSQVFIGIINVVFTLLAIWLIDRIGRKPLLLIGTAGMLISLTSIGLLFFFGKADGLLLLVFILVFIACFAFSLGPVVWVLLAEIYPNSIRGRAMSIATVATWIATSIIGQLIPVSMDNLGPANTFWLFALFCLPTLYIGWKIMPETKGRTLEEIELHWIKSFRK